MIDGDGLTYYALARSVVEDQDVDLRNQRQQIPNLHLKINQRTRRVAAHFSFGFGICYAPFLFVADKLTQSFPVLQEWAPYPQNRIIPFTHALAVFCGSVLFGFFTIVICYHLLQKSHGSPGLSMVASIAGLVGTPLLFYIFTMPSYAHAADAFLVTAAFYLAVSAKTWYFREWNLRNTLLGLTLAVSVLLRNNNIVLIPPLLLGLLFRESKQGDRNPVIVLFEVFIGALPFMILLGMFNVSQYGELVATGYRLQFEEQFLIPMLFHPYAGLFVWTPLTVLGLAGLIAGSIKRRPEAVIALASVLLALFSIQFQANWWGGCAFGPRFFTHLYVFWAWGLVECVRILKRPVAVSVIGLCAGWTFFLFNVFFANAVSPEFRALLRADKCRRTPADMITFATSDYISSRKAGETRNPLGFWYQSLGKGRYPTVLPLLRKEESTEKGAIQLDDGE